VDFWLIVVIAFVAAVVIGFGIVIRRGRADAVSGSNGTGSGSGTTVSAAAPPTMNRETLDAAVGALLAEGKVIPAIKLLREQTGFGVAQSKDYVERLAAGAGSHAAAPAPSTRASISSDAMAQIQQLVAQGKKIQAIKLVREHTGLGLKEAKDLVDRMEDSAAVGTLDQPAAEPQLTPSTPDDVMARVRMLAAQGKKIHAIKELRDHTPGLGLKEAKDIVEGL
jgi:ribosomal protein L7/L12